MTEELSAARRGLRDVAALRATLTRLETLLVDRARLESVSWQDIAGDLGITKQHAHRRHARHDPLKRAEKRRSRRPGYDRLIDGPDEHDAEITARVAKQLGYDWTKPRDGAGVPARVSDTKSRRRDAAP